jgi:hypothetical protein
VIRLLRASVLALCAAAPLHAQPPPPPACVPLAPTAAEADLAGYRCAGAGPDEAVRVSITVPASWRVAWQDTADLVLTAMDGDNVIWVVGSDELPRPLTRQDTLTFWLAAASVGLPRDATPAEVEAFRDASNGRIARARERAASAGLTDSALVALAATLSAAQGGLTVLEQELGVRTLDGEPAGFLSEMLEAGGRRWRFISYVTRRDGALFAISMNAIEDGHAALLPLFERVLASFRPRTERQ